MPVPSDNKLKAGDRIRILVDELDCASVVKGDVLRVTSVIPSSGTFETEAPRLRTPGLHWGFSLSDEGIGWERA